MEQPNYKDLKQQTIDRLQIRSEGKSSNEDFQQISQEDIQFLQKSKRQLVEYPIYSLAISVGILSLVKIVNLPDLIRNPFKPVEQMQVRYSFMAKFMRPHFTFMCVVFGSTVGIVKYELSKYFLYVKYQNLVNKYLDQCDLAYLSELRSQSEQVSREMKKK